MKRQNQSVVGILLVLSMVFTMFSGLMGIPTAFAGTATTLEPNYTGSPALPAGWTSVGAAWTLGTWNNFEGAQWMPNTTTQLFYGETWEGDLDYAWKQINIGNSTNAGNAGHIYFYYNDANNYYEVQTKATGFEVIKVAGGTATVLGSASTNFMAGDMAIRIKRTADGVVTVYHGAKGAVPTTAVLTTSVADTATPSGKIGVAFTASGGRFVGLKVSGTIASAPVPTTAPTTAPGQPVATSFIPNYNNATSFPTGWTSDGFTIGTWTNFETNTWTAGKTTRAIYDGILWTGAIDVTWKQVGAGGSGNTGNGAWIYFYYNDANNYYALHSIKTGVNASYATRIVKVTAGVEKTLGSMMDSILDQQASYRIVRDAAGAITVYKGANGTDQPTTTLFTATDDAGANPSGKIGVGAQSSTSYFAMPAIRGYAVVAGATPAPTATPGAGTTAKTFDPNYNGQATVPAGWTNTGFTWLTWGGFEANIYGNDANIAKAIYNTDIWTGAFDYTLRQINVWGGSKSGRMYFFYNDDNNYYALNIGSSGTTIDKVVNGTKTVLGTASTNLINTQCAVRIIRDADGYINVYSGAKGTIPAITGDGIAPILTTTVADTANPSGKIGFCLNNGGGQLATSMKLVGTVVSGSTPSATPAPTATPAATPSGEQPVTIPWEAQFYYNVQSNYGYNGNKNFAPLPPWTGTGFEVGSWNNYLFTAANGKLIEQEYDFYTLDYTVSQASVQSCTSGLLYFMYQDDNNYYAMEMTATGVNLLKKYQGTTTTLGTSSTVMINKQIGIRVQRQSDGKITLWQGKKDSPYTENVLLVSATDTALTHGKIGIGYTGGPGGGSYFTNPVAKGNVSANPTHITGTVPAVTTAPAGAVSFSPLTAARFVGRGFTTTNGAANAAFPMAGIEFNVTGAKEVYLSVKGPARIAVYIDDSAECTRMNLSNFTTQGVAKLVDFGTVGDHKIRIEKMSAWTDTLSIFDIKVVGNTPNVFPTAVKSRKIEFVGDSITAGGSQYAAGSFDAAFGGDVDTNYAGRTKKYFGAEASLSAVGGGGLLVPNNNANSTYVSFVYAGNRDSSDTSMRVLWDFSQFTPDVIVVNVGTNGNYLDPTVKHTKADYVRFYNFIREKYNDPNNKIKILFALGAMNNNYENAWASIQEFYAEYHSIDPNIFITQIGDFKQAGPGAHPDFVQHQTMANLLIDYIEESVMPEWKRAEVSAGAYKMSDNSLTIPYRALNQVTTNTAGVVVAGLYDENGVLVAMNSKNASFTAAQTTVNDTIVLDVTNLNKSAKYTGKLFLWKDKGTMIPLATVEHITLN